jgi:hypothetical protein
LSNYVMNGDNKEHLTLNKKRLTFLR